ncbi:MAG: DNA polymerase IV [Legionellales bacterium]|nr:DNA polymerase IV [Legionellales bacterium]|tara:strand:+ start:1580 stop:2632 length:1053 start_codon:yes stop_codon:yes gene_type:complete
MKKIIHIDMDCFYASIEMRDNPELRNKPIAVGGDKLQRGVLCTCNYTARKFGVHSAMPSFKALERCPDLIILPVRMDKYREDSQKIRHIFHKYTHLVEPLSLDEAFLDVTNCKQYQGSATLIAQAIRQEIADTLQITASAGIAPNKFIAKIASDWNKPNGQFVVTPEEVPHFIQNLNIKKIFGVGKVTALKFEKLGIETCGELQQLTLEQLTSSFGKFGVKLYELCRGIDLREVNTNRIRKSQSVETTFSKDIDNLAICHKALNELYIKLENRLKNTSHQKIYKQFIKIKFFDFTITSAEMLSSQLQLENFHQLFNEGFARKNKALRLLGIGVRFKENDTDEQLALPFEC